MGDPLVRRIANANIKSNKVQTKILSANVQLNTTLGDLTFNNLQVGKIYHLTGVLATRLDDIANDDAITITIINGVSSILQFTPQIGTPDATADNQFVPVNLKFVAVASTITVTTVDASTSSYVIGNNTTTNGTYLQLEEKNDLVFTTDFT